MDVVEQIEANFLEAAILPYSLQIGRRVEATLGVKFGSAIQWLATRGRHSLLFGPGFDVVPSG